MTKGGSLLSTKRLFNSPTESSEKQVLFHTVKIL